ncbi:MAG: hypothetical protein FWG73_03405 [Planctomycetaceae bacterium]|nr:hypothetical protein [Planctomycetaceae bacterium]
MASMTSACLVFFATAVVSAALWETPKTDVLQTQLASFLEIKEDEQQEGEILLADSSPAKRFDDVIAILRHSSLPIQHYLDQCDRLAWQELPFGQPITLPQTPLDAYIGEGQENYLFGALRYYLAQRLVQARLFDEAKKVLADLSPENSIDPAGVLIAKAVVFHHFADKEAGLAALKEFQAIADQEVVSRRSMELAKLLQFEWERQAQEDEAEQISRQMNDVRRRLGQGRTDEDTQNAEGDVLQSLENLIERLEEQAQRRQRAGSASQPNAPPDGDGPQSELRGPGNVDRRDFSLGDSWGNLPPREREEALLRIEREFPSQYRDIIEQYFREMAR